MTEQEQEDLIQAAKLTAPRLTPTDIYATIVDEQYYVFPRTAHTVCCLILRNGFTVIGESACASHQNFNPDIGRKIAFEHARQKIWQLEGYLLVDRLHGQQRLANNVFTDGRSAAAFKSGQGG